MEGQNVDQVFGQIKAATAGGKLVPELCEAMGGHCWESDDGIRHGWQHIEHIRACKHCGKRQVGTPQESIDWRDA